MLTPITAELELISKATPTSTSVSRWLWVKKIALLLTWVKYITLDGLLVYSRWMEAFHIPPFDTPFLLLIYTPFEPGFFTGSCCVFGVVVKSSVSVVLM